MPAPSTWQVAGCFAFAVLACWYFGLRRQTWRPRPAPTLADDAERLAVDERARRAEGQ